MSFTHTFSAKLAAGPDAVFRALTDRAALETWFAEHAEPGKSIGEGFRFWGRHTLGSPKATDATQRITRYEPGTALGFSWRLRGVDTEVELALTSDGEAGTRLSLRHEIRGDLGIIRAKELIEDHWRFALGNLAAHLAGGAGIVLPDYDDPAPVVRMILEIAAPPARVFRALIEPESVNRWLCGSGAIVEPRVGGRYIVGWKYQVDGRDVAGGPTRILEYVQDRKLVLDWPDWRGDDTVTGQTISFTLEPNGAGTRLTFVHAGFTRTADIGDYPFGWDGFLDMLKQEVTGA
ncbi:MAG: SRPBCC domain-containing protein [Gemmatimonadetes bacterium]|nr:SRPBCC domain-containing protein [Gemmatimonadota bacterium]